MLPLPPGFSSLSTIETLPVDSLVNVIATFEEKDEPKLKTKIAQNVYLSEPGYRSQRAQGFRFSLYVEETSHLPAAKAKGDVLLIRGAKVDNYNGYSEISIPNEAYLETYMSGRQQLSCQGPRSAKESLTTVEERYIIDYHIREVIDREARLLRTLPPQGAPRGPANMTTRSDYNAAFQRASDVQCVPGRSVLAGHSDYVTTKLNRSKSRGKLHLIKDIALNSSGVMFTDLCVELLTKHDDRDHCEIKVADYTENSLLAMRAAPENWRLGGDLSSDEKLFPYGQYVLKIFVKSPHREIVMGMCKIGEIILLENVKLTRVVPIDSSSHIAGWLWPDKKYVYVHRMHNGSLSACQDIAERKAALFAQRKAQSAASMRANVPALQVCVTSNNASAAQDKAEGKTERRRRKKAAKKAHAAEKAKGNKNVRCSNADQELRSIRDVLDANSNLHVNSRPDGTTYILPFINVSYKVKVRVLDFWPDKLEAFTTPAQQQDRDPDDMDVDDEPNNTAGFEWAFQLLVEDANVPRPSQADQIVVNVGRVQAQFLFGNAVPNPSDPTKNNATMAKLRETMYVLWGDLAEKKSIAADISEATNHPFEACISEYGVLKKDGDPADIGAWQRQYMLHGVTIH